MSTGSAPGPNGVTDKVYKYCGPKGLATRCDMMRGAYSRHDADKQNKRKGERTVILVIELDIANAYGTVPHQLIDIILHKFPVTRENHYKSKTKDFIKRLYYNSSVNSYQRKLKQRPARLLFNNCAII